MQDCDDVVPDTDPDMPAEVFDAEKDQLQVGATIILSLSFECHCVCKEFRSNIDTVEQLSCFSFLDFNFLGA